MHTRLALAALVVTSIACGPEGPTPAELGEDEADVRITRTAELTVIGGFGSGLHPIGARVHVFADLDPSSESMIGWAFGHGAEWHETIEVPAGGLTIRPLMRRPTFEVVDVPYVGTTARTKLARVALHPSARGVVLLLHGTSGSSAIADKTEARQFLVAAFAEGLTVIAPEAEESVAGDLDGNGKLRWNVDADADNVDLWNLQHLLRALERDGRIPRDVPRYAVGISNGGAFAVSLGAVSRSAVASLFPELRFDAAVSYCASGVSSAVDRTTTPTAWRMCGQDQHEAVGAEGNRQAIEHSLTLARRGIRTNVHVHAPSPLYAERFVRVPGIDVETSRAITAELVQGGFVDRDGFLTETPEAIAAMISADPATFPTVASLPGALVNDVVTQLRVVYADHTFFADWNDRTLDFLLDR
jgi:hypothetical protein